MVLRDLADAGTRPHHRDSSVLGRSEVLVDVSLYIYERNGMDSTLRADEVVGKNLDALGHGVVVAVVGRCSAFPERAGFRDRRDLEIEPGPRRARRCLGLGRRCLIHNIETTVRDKAVSR